MIAGLFILPIVRPILPVETLIKYLDIVKIDKQVKFEHNEIKELPQIIADRFGWPEMVAKINNVYLSLSPEERSECVIITSNYGEAGAIEHFGKQYNLPKPVSGHLQYYMWGTRGHSGEIAIFLDDTTEEQLSFFFEDVKKIDQTENKYAMSYENNKPIFICKKLKITLKEGLEYLKAFD